MRQARVERQTKETQITAKIDLDGTGRYDVTTGIGSRRGHGGQFQSAA